MLHGAVTGPGLLADALVLWQHGLALGADGDAGPRAAVAPACPEVADLITKAVDGTSPSRLPASNLAEFEQLLAGLGSPAIIHAVIGSAAVRRGSGGRQNKAPSEDDSPRAIANRFSAQRSKWKGKMAQLLATLMRQIKDAAGAKQPAAGRQAPSLPTAWAALQPDALATLVARLKSDETARGAKRRAAHGSEADADSDSEAGRAASRRRKRVPTAKASHAAARSDKPEQHSKRGAASPAAEPRPRRPSRPCVPAAAATPWAALQPRRPSRRPTTSKNSPAPAPSGGGGADSGAGSGPATHHSGGKVRGGAAATAAEPAAAGAWPVAGAGTLQLPPDGQAQLKQEDSTEGSAATRVASAPGELHCFESVCRTGSDSSSSLGTAVGAGLLASAAGASAAARIAASEATIAQLQRELAIAQRATAAQQQQQHWQPGRPGISLASLPGCGLLVRQQQEQQEQPPRLGVAAMLPRSLQAPARLSPAYGGLPRARQLLPHQSQRQGAGATIGGGGLLLVSAEAVAAWLAHEQAKAAAEQAAEQAQAAAALAARRAAAAQQAAFAAACAAAGHKAQAPALRGSSEPGPLLGSCSSLAPARVGTPVLAPPCGSLLASTLNAPCACPAKSPFNAPCACPAKPLVSPGLHPPPSCLGGPAALQSDAAAAWEPLSAQLGAFADAEADACLLDLLREPSLEEFCLV